MMIFLRSALLVLAAVCCSPSLARVVKDTVTTADGDRIIVSYEIVRNDDKVTVSFIGQQKKLGRVNSGKYKDVSKIAVMFFERTGGFSRDIEISKMIPEAFMVPANVKYNRSADGFFILQDQPTLKFSVKGNLDITIPLYLAYHPKKGKYELFSKSSGLRIYQKASQSVSPSNAQHPSSSNREQGGIQQTITSTAEIETDNTDLIKIPESVHSASAMIDEATKLPFSESLLEEIRYLREKKREIVEPALLQQIEGVLEKYERKKTELENEASAAEKAAQDAAEAKAAMEAKAAKAEADSIAAAQAEEAKKAEERNMWMVIGGILLAILGFVGNQVMQNRRNAKNQKNMMDMQQSIASKAENEAKRQAQNAARRAQNAAKSEIRKHTKIKVNGKTKDLSI